MKKTLFSLISISCFLYLTACSEISSENFLSTEPVSKYNRQNSIYMDGDADINNNILYNFNSKKAGLTNNKYNKWYNPLTNSSGRENMTSKSQLSCYNAIIKNCSKISDKHDEKGNYPIETIILPNCHISSSGIKKVLYAVQSDRPDIFWISNTFSISYFDNNTALKFYSIISQSECVNNNQKLESAVINILKAVDKNMPEYEKELYIHDWLTQNCSYDKSERSWSRFTAYGALVEKKAVCEGYSKAFELLLCSLGVNCRTVTGTSKGEPHMWNLVQINKNWYHTDVTWDSSDPLFSYNYFNISTGVIQLDHSIDPDFNEKMNFNYNPRYNFNFPDCSSLEENYFIKNAVKINSLGNKTDELIIDKLVQTSENKKKYLHIIIEEPMNYEKTLKQLFSISPYKFMYCIDKANSLLTNGSKIEKKVRYSENRPLKAITVEINYI